MAPLVSEWRVVDRQRSEAGRESEAASPRDRTDNWTETKQRLFRAWLTDTLRSIPQGHYGTSGGSVRQSVEVGEDSLWLSVLREYSISADSRDVEGSKDAVVVVALDMLRRQNDLPTGRFQLEVAYATHYRFSPIDRFVYEVHDEVENLTVITDGTVARYETIHGRIASKDVTTVVEGKRINSRFEYSSPDGKWIRDVESESR